MQLDWNACILMVKYSFWMLTGVENINADHAVSHLGEAHGIVNVIRSVMYDA